MTIAPTTIDATMPIDEFRFRVFTAPTVRRPHAHAHAHTTLDGPAGDVRPWTEPTIPSRLDRETGRRSPVEEAQQRMMVLFGIVVVALSLLCWLGQTISWFAPAKAVELSLMEAEEAVDPAFFADVRGEAGWDAMTLWTMVVAGTLMLFDQAAWPYFGLVGGGMYAYFAGRGILVRMAMRRRGLRIGSAANVRVGLTFLAIWGAMAVVVIVASINELRNG
jgi:hypothetical protein